jgi:hypothetical protein
VLVEMTAKKRKERKKRRINEGRIIENKEKKEILVIVAHPDDETIWMGGTLLKRKYSHDSNITVISLCRSADRDREPKFRKACEVLNVEGHIFDIDDGEVDGVYQKISSEDIIKNILEVTKDKLYNVLYTHGPEGEYGHIRHLEVNKAVEEMLSRGLLLVEEVLFFSYKKVKNKFQGYAIHNSNADKLIRLGKPYLKIKKMIIQEIYGYKKGGFEEESCKEVEAFDIRE